MENINVLVVYDSNGAVDSSAMSASFQSELAKFKAENETQTSAIASAVSTVFDNHKGQRITTPALCSLAVAELNAQPSNWSVLTERVANYIRANASEGGLFSIAKGKNGGVARVADLPVASK